MSSQGPLGCGTGATTNTPSNGATAAAWVNPGNITADDTNFATYTRALSTAGVSQHLLATNFGFSIPAGATINGIVVEWECKSNSTARSPRDLHSYIAKAGTIQVTNDYATGTSWPTTQTFKSYGTGTTDLWGLTWSVSDINDSGFGAAISGQVNAGKGTVVMSVNYCRIIVYYTAAGGTVPTPYYYQQLIAGGVA